MFTFPFKNRANITLIMIINYFVWAFIISAAILFSWLFLFVYKNIYTVVTQQMAIANLKTELTITKVHKTQFNNLVNKFEEKQMPSVVINFNGLANPFKPPAKTE